MGRPLRIEYPDALYHITARENERQNIFKGEKAEKNKNGTYSAL